MKTLIFGMIIAHGVVALYHTDKKDLEVSGLIIGLLMSTLVFGP